MKLRLHFPVRRLNSLLGWPGMIGAGGLVMCVALYFSTVQPVQQRLDTARLSAISLHDRITRASQALNDNARPIDEQLATFYQIFPSERDSTEWVGKIAAIAKRNGLILQQVDYKTDRDKNGKLIRFQMSLPLTGEYQTIRKFLSELQAQIPIVSLEQVQFERQNVGSSLVNAKLRLVIFLGRPS